MSPRSIVTPWARTTSSNSSGVIGFPCSKKTAAPRWRTRSSSTPRDVMPLPSTFSMPKRRAPRLVTEPAGTPL